MIEFAAVSGRLGMAVFQEAGRRYVMATGRIDAFDCRPQDWADVIDTAGPDGILPADGLDIDRVRGALADETDRHDSLSMLITGFDPSFSDETRTLSIKAAEKLLGSPDNAAFARARLLGCPMPDDADVTGALRLAKAAGAERTAALYDTLGRCAPCLPRTWTLWNEAAARHLDEPGRIAAQSLLIHRGVFATVTERLAEGTTAKLFDLVMTAGRDPTLSQAVPHLAHILTHIAKAAAGAAPAPKAAPIKADRTVENEEDAAPEADPIAALILDALSKGRDRPQRTGQLRLESIQKSVAYIGDALRAGRTDRAMSELESLVRQQLRHSAPSDVAKTLCAIAAEATATGQGNIALTIIGYAKLLDVPDPVIGNTEGEALRSLGRPDDALTVFENTANRFPSNPFAPNGYAETLRTLGRLDEALLAYNSTIHDFHRNIVARNGRAETLRTVGRLDEALQAYESTIRDFPRDIVARNGRAETLRTLGRLDEALQAYESTIRDFPHDVVARNGRAETLRTLGRLDEALQAYESTIRDFHRDVVARNGRAETLRTLGRLDEALLAYNSTIHDFHRDVVARTGLAETLRALGRLDEALLTYNSTIREFPHDIAARNGRASTLMLLSRFEEVRISLHVSSPRTRNDWISAHIVAMSHLREGNVAESVQRLRTGLHITPFADCQQSFAGALAVAELRLGRAMEAENVLRIDEYFKDRGRSAARSLLLCHAEAEIGRTEAAKAQLQRVGTLFPFLAIQRLKLNLARRYGFNNDTQARLTNAECHELDQAIFDDESLIIAA